MAEADRLVDGASVKALPGAQAFVARVRAAGLFLGLVTGDHRARTMAHLRALQLETSFDAVVTADDSVLQKPDSAPLRLVLHGQSWDPGDCVMVGDSCNDWTMAQTLAIPVIAIGSEVIHHPAVIRTVPDLRSICVTGAIEEDQIVTHTRDASTTL